MWKAVLSFVAFAVVWAAVELACFYLGRLFDRDWLVGWPYYVVIFVSCSAASQLGHRLSAWLEKRIEAFTAKRR